jgi:hypothetical protein
MSSYIQWYEEICAVHFSLVSVSVFMISSKCDHILCCYYASSSLECFSVPHRQAVITYSPLGSGYLELPLCVTVLCDSFV